MEKETIDIDVHRDVKDIDAEWWQVDPEAAERLGRARQAMHPRSKSKRLDENDVSREHIIGAAGELAFSRITSLPMDLGLYEQGDSGVDFTFQIKRRIYTIDVKTTRNLMTEEILVKEREIMKKKAALFIAQATCTEDCQVKFWFWETRGIMRMMPTKTVNEIVGESVYRPFSECRPMWKLYELIRRDDQKKIVIDYQT